MEVTEGNPDGREFRVDHIDALRVGGQIDLVFIFSPLRVVVARIE